MSLFGKTKFLYARNPEVLHERDETAPKRLDFKSQLTGYMFIKLLIWVLSAVAIWSTTSSGVPEPPSTRKAQEVAQRLETARLQLFLFSWPCVYEVKIG